MYTYDSRPEPNGSKTLETLAFRYLGEKTMVHIQHRRGDRDYAQDSAVYPVTTGDALGFPVFALGQLPDTSEFMGEIIAVLFDTPQHAGPILITAPEGQKLYRPGIEKALGLETGFAEENHLYCLYEKSAGAVPYTRESGKRKYLILHSAKGHYCFPKGHLEAGESDEGAALREVWEETGLQIDLIPGFTHTTFYRMDPGYEKEVVYFIGVFTRHAMRLQVNEVVDAEILEYQDVLDRLTYENDRELLRLADSWLRLNIYNPVSI